VQASDEHKEETLVSSILVRFSGLAAILGDVLGIVLTPFLTYLWATYSDVYGYFGRVYFLVFIGCLVGLAGLYAQRRASMGSLTTCEPDTEKWVFVLILVGFVLSLVGDILEYWGGSPGEDFTTTQVQGFGIEMAGLLLVLCGSVAFGLIYRKSNILPTLLSWMLIAAGPAGVVLSALHVPSGTMLVFCCAWLVLGHLLSTGKVASTRRPLRVS
jgi:hypothetical protein